MTTWSGAMTPTGTMFSAVTMNCIGRHRHHGIEIARRQGVGEIAEVIRQKCVHQREIGAQRSLEQVRLAVNLDLLLAFLDEGADAGRRQYAAEAAAAGADALHESALRDQVDSDVLAQHLLLCLRVQPDVGADHARHLRAFEQLADALAGYRRVIADQGKARLLLPHQLVQQAFRRAHAHETADHDARAVRDHRDGFFGGNGPHDWTPVSRRSMKG